MQKTALLILSLISEFAGSFGQSRDNPVLESLFFYDQPIATITWDGFKYIDPADKKDTQFDQFAQCLIRNNKGLFVFINGTGRLYQAALNNGKIVFTRLDSTVYFGSNFKSFAFSYKDVIYNLGGYGFWKTNGLLRYYVEKRKEWEIIKLNKEVPLLTENTYDLIWFDQSEGKLYFGFTREENNVTTADKSTTTFHYETVVLDLEKKEWKTLGRLSDFLKKDIVSLTNMTSSPWGQMVGLKGNILFLNYKENKIYRLKLSQEKQKIMDLFPTNTGDPHVYYFKDSVFFSGISSMKLLDSVVISLNELKLLDEKIFMPEGNLVISKNNSKKSSDLLIFLLAGAVLIFLISFQFRKIFFNPADKTQNSKSTRINVFSDIEKEVLKAIVANSRKGRMTSIDELNYALGVTKKSIEVQKKQRSDVISSINKKYFYINNGNQELIERKQADFDKRSFEYYIGHEKISFIISIINQT